MDSFVDGCSSHAAALTSASKMARCLFSSFCSDQLLSLMTNLLCLTVFCCFDRIYHNFSYIFLFLLLYQKILLHSSELMFFF